MKGCVMWKANTIARLHNINHYEIKCTALSCPMESLRKSSSIQLAILVHPCCIQLPLILLKSLVCSLLSCCGGLVVTVLCC